MKVEIIRFSVQLKKYRWKFIHNIEEVSDKSLQDIFDRYFRGRSFSANLNNFLRFVKELNAKYEIKQLED